MNEQNTNQPGADRLDELLRQWDDQSQPTTASLSALQERISSALKDQVSKTSDSMGVTENKVLSPASISGDLEKSKSRSWKIFAFAGTAAAALLVFGIVFSQLPRGQVTPDPVPGEKPDQNQNPQFVQIKSQQLSNQAILLAEMEQVFNKQLVWVSESNGEVQMGLDNGKLNVNQPQQPLSIRVVLARRDKDGSWTQLWKVDVMSRSQHVVRLDPGTADDVEISLWAFVLPDGMIAVDSTYSTAGSLPMMNTDLSNLQTPGEPMEVLSQRNDDKEYRVFQTVALLDRA